LRIRFLNWWLRFWDKIDGLVWRASFIGDWVEGTEMASWYASVGKKLVTSVRPAWPREKKKLAASRSSAMVWAMVDLPEPAGPYSQNIARSSSPSAHFNIFAMTPSRVPSWQADANWRSLELYAAPGTFRSFRIVKTDPANGYDEC